MRVLPEGGVTACCGRQTVGLGEGHIHFIGPMSRNLPTRHSYSDEVSVRMVIGKTGCGRSGGVSPGGPLRRIRIFSLPICLLPPGVQPGEVAPPAVAGPAQ